MGIGDKIVWVGEVLRLCSGSIVLVGMDTFNEFDRYIYNEKRFWSSYCI